MKIGRLLNKAGKLAKENPEVALAVLGLALPGVARKAPKIIAKAAPFIEAVRASRKG